MVQSKLPNNLDIEELLKVVSESKEKLTPLDDLDIYGINEDVKKFILVFNLKAGNDPVTTKFLQRVYKAWGGKVSKTTFGIELSKYIQIVNGIYNIDEASFKINEDIINKLKGPNKTKSAKYRKDFESFLSDNKIKKGPTYVFWQYVFKIYQRWCQEKKKRTISKQQFYKFCKLYFNIKQSKEDQRKYIGISRKLETLLTKEILEGIKKEVRSENKFYKIKEESKEKSQEATEAGVKKISN